ncbi:Membrane protein involved in the export of O-antigen and teichoic acid [Tenacibaculum sp. 190524A02b]|uniref:sugar isomerase n=1 Tax=Tenacibaculum vairaonense TaxID=3137860 RepID=UPI0032B2239B
MKALFVWSDFRITPSQWFMISVMIVNAGNYAYNLVLGRWVGPDVFSNIALLITLLLVLSFLAMTAQLLCAKYVIELPKDKVENFKKVSYKYSFLAGGLLGVVCVLNASNLKQLFNVPSEQVFYIFGLGIPLYFIMSVSRGILQGKQQFIGLSQSYLLEMFARLTITFFLIGFNLVEATFAVGIGIFMSFVFGMFPNQFKWANIKTKSKLTSIQSKSIFNFLVITLLYEGTQILINNSDILIVKHYFNNYQSGLYASLALIGRVVYFVIWMLIMILLPKLIEAKKEGENPKAIFNKYLKYIVSFTSILIFGCYLFPETIISLLFGKEYIALSYLLYKYAMATSLFALANLFIYYFLSISKYKPVIIAMFFGIAQVLLLIIFHISLAQVVYVQITLMFILLLFTLFYYRVYS